MRKPCKSRACDNESQKGPSVYCSNECKCEELSAVRKERYAEEFGDLLTKDRFCICGDLLVLKPDEGVRNFMNRGSCSRSCAAKTSRQATKEEKTAEADRKIAVSMKRLRDNRKTKEIIKMKQGPMRNYWDQWSSESKLIQNALMGTRLC